KVPDEFVIKVGTDVERKFRTDLKLEVFPVGAEKISKLDKEIMVIPPEGEKIRVEQTSDSRIYHCPKESKVRTEAVDRWSLAMVIAMAVASICLWGTLVG